MCGIITHTNLVVLNGTKRINKNVFFVVNGRMETTLESDFFFKPKPETTQFYLKYLHI